MHGFWHVFTPKNVLKKQYRVIFDTLVSSYTSKLTIFIRIFQRCGRNSRYVKYRIERPLSMSKKSSWYNER